MDRKTIRIAMIPGDGIGIDVLKEAEKVLKCLDGVFQMGLRLDNFDYGAERYLKTGKTLSAGELEELRTYDAILLGALGDPRVPDMKHASDILLGIRFQMDLFVNHRPVKLLHDRLCPLKDRTRKDIDFVVFRENTEGLYVGIGGIFKRGTPDEIAVQEDVNTRKGVERILRYGFEYARKHGNKKVTMADKSNVLTYGHDLWQRTFMEIAPQYPEISSNHLYIDALAMQMIKNPAQFEVIVTSNMFGDIITDLGAQLQGGLGMAGSGNLYPGGTSMFEPVHGSAPKYAGKNVANPFGMILSTQMMLDFLEFPEAGARLEAAVIACLEEGKTTRDVGGSCTTTEVGDHICRFLERDRK